MRWKALIADKKSEILRCGRELFKTKGFKGTNVADIMKLAGLGTGTFYNYYTSKDMLFMEIFLEENARLKARILRSVDLEGDPMDVMKQIMFLNHRGMSSDPILKEWYNRDVFGKIEQVYREQSGAENVDFLYSGFMEVVKKWQAQGKLRSDIAADMIMAIFAAIINADTHKEEIGLQYFPEVLEHLAEFAMNGLLIRSHKSQQ